jgi:ribulose-5-phosphate 4-epimerase/fuculose-1-phosphate aldolase
MQRLVQKYEENLVRHGLCDPGTPVVGGINDTILWNRETADRDELEAIINGLNINSLIFAKPAAPFMPILDFHARRCDGEFIPEDTETRTFLHSIPVCKSLDSEMIIPVLKRRKGVVVAGEGIITYGTVSPEQAFVVFSSIIFSAFVKFFVDFAYLKLNRETDEEMEALFPAVWDAYQNFLPQRKSFDLIAGPLNTEADIITAMKQAGLATVDARMVDSFFGNISFRDGNTIYISQTGSSMDELGGCIDACPIDGSASTGITASSELVAHRDIYLGNTVSSILHGHPKFSVIMSMICTKEACENRDKCHIKCTEQRFINDIPIVPGEVGTGPRGLSRTLPPAMKGRRGVIVFGHGVFTVGQEGYVDAFGSLMDIERMCKAAYWDLISA